LALVVRKRSSSYFRFLFKIFQISMLCAFCACCSLRHALCFAGLQRGVSMSRTAVHHWQNRIAPVFDVGGRIVMVEDGTGTRGECILPQAQPLQLAENLCAQGVGTLICGAVSRSMQEALAARDIRVIGFVAGDLERVIAAWRNGELDDTFAMPGCRAAGLGCRGRMQHTLRRTRSCHEEMEPDHEGLDRKPGAEPGCARTRNRRRDSAAGRLRALGRGEDGGSVEG
jgi:predicted Fe-Mo cluster-binding NifX family protein